ncbi:MAG TPA: DUF559 domain-containing protein [Acidimicrobiales bacterium]|nr:DUF559 domain-containing protein [Acidimicrobiales bacterium]
MTRWDVDRGVARIAATQWGVFSRGQVFEQGGTDDIIEHRTAVQMWDPLAEGVYGLAGYRPSFERRLWIARLAIGGDVVVTRTLVDMAGVVRPGQLRRFTTSLDDALGAKQTSPIELGRCLRRLTRRGKPGMRLMAVLLDERSDGKVPPASKLERMLFAALKAAGEPSPLRQFALPGRQLITGFVDAAYPEARLIIEVDGRRWHTRIRDLAKDHLRDREAALAGWLTVRFMWEDLKHDAAGVAADIRTLRVERTPKSA